MKFFCVTLEGSRGCPHRFDNILGMGYSGECLRIAHEEEAGKYGVPRMLGQALYLTLAEAKEALDTIYVHLYKEKAPRIEVFDWPDDDVAPVKPRALTADELKDRCPDSCANCAFHCQEYQGTYMFSGDSWDGDICALESRTNRGKDDRDWNETICPLYRDDRKASHVDKEEL